MNVENTVTIRWTLNEHDATSVLHLLGHEMERTPTIWQPYWQRLVDSLHQAIQDACLASSRQQR